MIRILLFAHLKEQLNAEEITLPFPELTVHQLRQELKDRYGLSSVSSLMIAVNEEFATDDEMIREGDVVALIPPVSGG
ncbi:molybdopterin converting factor subunit 1 [Bacillus alveayuensis]|jgi:molybdopterin synthase sulfur carrier subunit|uniref:Molybdopterin synthase sulfur carrier subunit n=1 Tax=Aeribacillus alveayuensis TaxID=279215 RepID=A0ABT9VPW3_9BACI|nr:molybdopterin converting factor subunit 1 [Bacillus alveayuensis]MDQ0162993.1 molybdopterin synthase sulfur carrier subunit [Bacillus alveayuensis]